MNIAEFVELPDLEKLLIQEIKLKRQLAEELWTVDPLNANVYYLNFDDGEVVSVELDGAELDEEYSRSDCNGNADSFYYDDYAKRLYIHTTDSDDPATMASSLRPKYSIVAYFYRGWANRPVTIERMDQLLINKRFDWWTTSTNMETWVETIAGGSTIIRGSGVYDDLSYAYLVAISIDAVPNAAYFAQTIITKPGRKCKIRVLYKTGAGDTASLVIRNTPGNNVYLDLNGDWATGWTTITLPASTAFTWFEINFVANDNYSDYQFMIYCAVANADIWIQETQFWRYRLPVYYNPRLPSNLPTINQSVGTYVHPESKITMGEIVINNDGFFLDKKDIYLWHNCRIETRIGELTTEYDDLAICFNGFIRKPRFSAGEFRAQTTDDRLNLKKIPIDRLDLTTFPNVDPKYLNRPQPIVLGSTARFLPPCINTTNYTYKPTQATFNGVNYGINAIQEVRVGERLLATPADYAEDLVDGELTLTADPRDAEVSCRIDALQVSQFGDSYAWKISDWPYFLLVILNQIDKQRLVWAAFKDLYDNRNLQAELVLMDEINTLEVMNLLQRTIWFHFFTQLNGDIVVRRYSETVPDDVLRLYDEDVKNWNTVLDTDQSYKELVIKKRKDHIKNIYEDLPESFLAAAEYAAIQDKIEWEHGIKTRLIIETPLNSTLQSGTVFENYIEMMEDPPEVISFDTINHGALLLNPTDKFKLTLSEEYDDGVRTVYDDITFQVISIAKNLGSGETKIKAFTGWAPAYWYVI